MHDIEKRLLEEKKRMDPIRAPEEVEMRLRSALHRTPPKRTKRIALFWKLAAIAIFCMVSVGYHYNAFAFYGKQLLGFDEVLTDTLKELNDEGMGQIVAKKIQLEDGTELFINRIMTDANQLIMYYTLTNPNGLEHHTRDLFRPFRVTGFLTNSYVETGTSIENEKNTEIRGIYTFEPVSPFSKNLTLHFRQQLANNQVKEESISFAYNPNKAMQTVFKQSIQKTLEVDKGTITFQDITATPTMTVLNGTLNVENFDRVPFALGGIELMANGTVVDLMGGGSQSSLVGKKFDIRYDALPKQIDSLQLLLKEFVGYQVLEKKVPLDSPDNEPILLQDKELWVKHVATTSQGVEITIATEEDVMLDGVAIETQNGITSLRTTVNQIQTELENGQILKERTLLFDTTAEPEYLLIEGMHYMKLYNQVIDLAGRPSF